MSEAASAMLDSFNSERQIIEAVVSAYRSDGMPSTQSPSHPTASQSPPAERIEQGASSDSSEPPAESKESIPAILAELDALVGLESVKRQLKRVIAVVQANTERAKAGLSPVTPGLHLVFTGPPGTGKTTVARVVARLYAAAEALPGAGFTEATRADLVAGYVGQTAIKTAEIIARTRPGVLFIDEAYALTPRHDSDFGAEAIAALVKAMEDYRRDFAVIVAGYAEEMAAFIGSNPGLRSRFKTYIDFPSYTPSELIRIFQDFASASNIRLGPGVIERTHSIFDRAGNSTAFGNARFARSLFEEAYARMSARAAADGVISADELTEITIEDVEWNEEAIYREVRRIGFNGK
jgi:SpoVK/Ycf46/Vps4 family AAA+-type ATPase